MYSFARFGLSQKPRSSHQYVPQHARPQHTQPKRKRLLAALLVSTLAAVTYANGAPGALSTAETLASDAPKVPALSETMLTEGDHFNAATSVVNQYLKNGVEYRNADGSYSADIYSKAVNFQDAAGKWKHIDDSLVSDGANGVRNASGPLTARFLSTTSPSAQGGQHPVLSLSSESQTLQAGLVGIKPGITPTVQGNVATYKNALTTLDNTDVMFVYTNGMVKQNIVLNQRPQMPFTTQNAAFRVPLSLTGLTASTSTDGTVVLRDTKGEIRFRVPKGLAWDDQYVRTGVAKVADVNVTLEDAGNTLVFRVDPKWLNDPARTYPITIDPVYDGASYVYLGHMDTFVDSNNPNTNFTRYYELGAYTNRASFVPGSNITQNVLFKQDIDLANGRTILDAQLRLYAYGSTPTAPIRVSPLATSMGDAATVTWNTRPVIGMQTVMYQPQSDTWANIDITDYVSHWTSGEWTNNGVQIDTAGRQAAYRFSAMENGMSAGGPYIHLTYGIAGQEIVPKVGGTYQLRSDFNNLVVGGLGGDGQPTPGQDIVQETRSNEIDQRWVVSRSYNEKGYLLTNQHTGLALGVAGSSRYNNAHLVQANVNRNDLTQFWRFFDTGNGRVTAINVGSGKSIDVPGNDQNWTSGQYLAQWDYVASVADEKWILTEVAPNGTPFSSTSSQFTGITSALSGKYIDVIGTNNVAEGAVIQQEAASQATDQRWELRPTVETGAVNIINVGSGKTMGVRNQSALDGAVIEQQTLNANNLFQRWRPIDLGYGNVVLHNVGSGMVFDVPGDDTTYGTAGLVQSAYNTSAVDQRWRINYDSGLEFELSWSPRADLDLQVTEPSGNALGYFDQGPSSTGGVLSSDDLGLTDTAHAERISWVDAPPVGQYVVRVTQARPSVTGDATWTLKIKKHGVVVQAITGTANSSDINYTNS